MKYLFLAGFLLALIPLHAASPAYRVTVKVDNQTLGSAVALAGTARYQKETIETVSSWTEVDRKGREPEISSIAYTPIPMDGSRFDVVIHPNGDFTFKIVLIKTVGSKSVSGVDYPILASRAYSGRGQLQFDSIGKAAFVSNGVRIAVVRS